MKVLITGATGYIGARLLNVLVDSGHTIVALTRSTRRLAIRKEISSHVQIIEGDLLEPETLDSIPADIDAAYYLVHSMGSRSSGFSELEKKSATNFANAINKTQASQIIYLSGLSRGNSTSEHMSSRHEVEKVLSKSKASLTILRAGIIVGSGSASFEIMRDLVEMLPIMVAPKWVYSRCQPIGIADILFYLSKTLGNEHTFGQVFEIGGPDVMTYRDLLQNFAKVRGLKRLIIPVPFLTPYLSSLWLFFVTSVNFSIAQALVKSLKIDAVCEENRIEQILPHKCLSFTTTVENAFKRIEQNAVVSSWRDSIVRSNLLPKLAQYIEVPTYGCLKKTCKKTYNSPKEAAINRLWKIGGRNGWYSMDWAWGLRGWIDQIFGGVGIRRGRTDPNRLRNGDALDFWRVIVADKDNGHLLLYAEMRLPGEAWLEWKISGNEERATVEQTATFRPRGILGRLYWYALAPIHPIIFWKLCNSIGKGNKHTEIKDQS